MPRTWIHQFHVITLHEVTRCSLWINETLICVKKILYSKNVHCFMVLFHQILKFLFWTGILAQQIPHCRIPLKHAVPRQMNTF